MVAFLPCSKPMRNGILPVEPGEIEVIAWDHPAPLVDLDHDLIDDAGQGFQALRVAVAVPLEQAGDTDPIDRWQATLEIL